MIFNILNQRTCANLKITMNTKNWKELEITLSDSILKTIEELKFFYMTPVQVKNSTEIDSLHKSIIYTYISINSEIDIKIFT